VENRCHSVLGQDLENVVTSAIALADLIPAPAIEDLIEL
jgi:hypothetical protein